jgi:hypothetical protein
MALRLVAALWYFWYKRGHLSEGRRWLEEALVRSDAPTPARAEALNGAGALARPGRLRAGAEVAGGEPGPATGARRQEGHG